MSLSPKVKLIVKEKISNGTHEIIDWVLYRVWEYTPVELIESEEYKRLLSAQTIQQPAAVTEDIDSDLYIESYKYENLESDFKDLAAELKAVDDKYSDIDTLIEEKEADRKHAVLRMNEKTLECNDLNDTIRELKAQLEDSKNELAKKAEELEISLSVSSQYTDKLNEKDAIIKKKEGLLSALKAQIYEAKQ